MRFQVDGAEVAITGPGLLEGWLQVALPGWAGLTTIGMLYRRGPQWWVGSTEFTDPEQACRCVLQQHRDRAEAEPSKRSLRPVAFAVATSVAGVAWLLYTLLQRR